MSIQFDPRLTLGALVQRGAAPVGFLQELPPVELTAILYLRLWCDGDMGRDQVARDFRLALGMDDAVTALMTFDALVQGILRGARRPLMCHGVECRCFGGDESAFANMLAAAASGDREDAMLFAAHLMAGDAAYTVVFSAMQFGLALLRLALLRLARAMPAPTHASPSHFTH